MSTTRPDIPRWVFRATLALYVVLAVAYNGSIRLGQAPDEPWHYRYVESLAAGKGLPNPKETHQAQHPPLYYAGAAIVRLAAGAVLAPTATWHAVRFLATLFGLGTVVLTYRLACLLAPEDPWLRIVTPAMVAFLPMFTYITSVVNNDSLVVLLLTAVLLLLGTYLRDGDERPVLAGSGVLGLAMLTKETALFAYVLLPLAILWRARTHGDHPGRPLAMALGIPAVIWAGWPLHNRLAHGTFFLHTTVQKGQENIAGIVLGDPLLIGLFVRRTLGSYPAPDWILKHFVEINAYLMTVLAAIVVIAVGLVVGRKTAATQPAWKRAFLWLCVLGLALLGLGIFHYFLFVDYTAVVGGRYLLSLAAALALLCALSIRSLLAAVRRPRLLMPAALVMWAVLLAADVWFLFTTRAFYTSGYWMLQG